MIRGVLTSFVALVIIGAGIGLGGPSHPNPAQASSHVVRSLSDQTVEPGGLLTVTINASQYGRLCGTDGDAAGGLQLRFV